MLENESEFKKAKNACMYLKEELGWPRWLKEVSVDYTNDFFLLMFVSRMDEEIENFMISKCPRGTFRGFEVAFEVIS